MTQLKATAQLRLSDITGIAWRFFSAHAADLLLITLAVNIPIDLLRLFATPNVFRFGSTAVALANLALTFFGTLAILATIIYVERGAAQGDSPSVQTAFSQAFSRWPAFLITAVLLAIFVFGLSLALVVPGIIFLIYWYFAIYLAALRGQAGWAALSQSRALVSGRWWRIFGITLGLVLLNVIAVAVVRSPLHFYSNTAGLDFGLRLIGHIITAYFVVATTHFFLAVEKSRAR